MGLKKGFKKFGKTAMKYKGKYERYQENKRDEEQAKKVRKIGSQYKDIQIEKQKAEIEEYKAKQRKSKSRDRSSISFLGGGGLDFGASPFGGTTTKKKPKKRKKATKKKRRIVIYQ